MIKRYLLAILITTMVVLLTLTSLTQQSDNPLWRDDNPHNDPDDPNMCFIYWNCTTDAHWEHGWESWQSEKRHCLLPREFCPKSRIGESWGNFNLCYSVWECQGEEEWLHGWRRGHQIFATATPPPPPTQVRRVTVEVVKYKVVTATPSSTPNYCATATQEFIEDEGKVGRNSFYYCELSLGNVVAGSS